MMNLRFIFLSLFLSIGNLLSAQFGQSSLPDGFVVQWESTNWDLPVGLLFDEEGTMYVWEKGGKVWMVKDGERLATPLIDISDEVGNFGDLGLLSFVLDPNFKENGYFYLYYAVDQYHLLNAASPSYDVTQNTYWDASIARVTRYQATSSSNFEQADLSSRKILIGETKETGIPLLYTSHGGGTLLFGSDGSLLITTGDGSTWKGQYVGEGPPYDAEYVPQAFELDLIRPEEEVGAFRSQLINNYNGKVLRIDPQTGEGLPSNPFYLEDAPFSPQSAVWALGFRNAFRAIMRPNSGTSNAENGLPGSIYVADVGEATWEELNVVTTGGKNYGWPNFEGNDYIESYHSQLRFNRDLPNPLFEMDGCEQEYFYFQDLIQQPNLNQINIPHPCNENEVISSQYSFFHERPALSFPHVNVSPSIHTAGFNQDGEAIDLTMEDAGLYGENKWVRGNAGVPIGFYEPTIFPEEYQNRLFMADYGQGWIKVIEMDLNDRPLGVQEFFKDTINIVHGAIHPVDGSIYFIDFPRGIRKISYGENVPPIAIASADINYGTSPLTVQFDGSASYDPLEDSINYTWDFGDGTSSTEISPTHTFTSSSSAPQSFRVSLSVNDEEGASSSDELLISLNNTPPNVNITSLSDGDLYPISGYSEYNLEAEVNDTEHGENELSYAWQTFFHHNTHFHPEPVDSNIATTTLIDPSGCGDEIYYYRIRLTVTDAAGLAAFDEVKLYPDCDADFVKVLNFNANLQENEVWCTWTSISELDLDFYELEKKGVNGDFQAIAKIEGENIHAILTDYQFVDRSPFLGKNFYRLKMVSNDGLIVYSQVKEIIYFDPETIVIFPNPTTGEAQIFFEHRTATASMTIYNTIGQKMRFYRWEDDDLKNRGIDLSDLQAGTYFYEVVNGKQITSGKIVIQ